MAAAGLLPAYAQPVAGVAEGGGGAAGRPHSAYVAAPDSLALAELALLQARTLGERARVVGALVTGGVVAACVAGVAGVAGEGAGAGGGLAAAIAQALQ